MLQKTQWTLAATAFAAIALLAPGAKPAQAQVRIHLTGPVTSQPNRSGGIIIPPSSPSSHLEVQQPQAQLPEFQLPEFQLPQVQTPEVQKPEVQQPQTGGISSRHSSRSLPSGLVHTSPAPAPVQSSAPQGFSGGPGILGAQRIRDGHMVNRIAPDIDGDGFPDLQKVPAHH